MDVLVLGGSVFLGRAVVAGAQVAGHDVTVFNRGVSGPNPPGVTHVRGDRTVAADLAQLGGRRFDLVVGPDDSAVGRLPWWLDRFARGGDTLVPGTPTDPVALIDARDLAAFALIGAPGTFECGGPAGRDTWRTLVDALQGATGTHTDPTWVDRWRRPSPTPGPGRPRSTDRGARPIARPVSPRTPNATC